MASYQESTEMLLRSIGEQQRNCFNFTRVSFLIDFFPFIFFLSLFNKEGMIKGRDKVIMQKRFVELIASRMLEVEDPLYSRLERERVSGPSYYHFKFLRFLGI